MHFAQAILFVQGQQIMLSFLFKSESSFQSNLNEYLNGNPQRLGEGKLHNVLSALRGEDPTIKSEIAFATLKKIITAFELDNKDIRILKELIILDQLVEENIFCNEISLTNFFAIQNNKSSSESAAKQNIRRVLRLFWKIIKDKSIIMAQLDHIFHEKRSQRDSYLTKLKPAAILNEIGTIEVFFTTIFQLLYCLEHPSYSEEKEVIEWRRTGVIDYIILHMLYKLFYLYNCQTTIHKHLIRIIESLTSQEMNRLKRYIIKFRDHCNKFINFIKDHQGIKGFQYTNYEDVHVEVNQRLIKFLDDYLHQLEVDSNAPILSKLPTNLGKIKVQRKPLTDIGKLNTIPRLRLACPEPLRREQHPFQANIFSNYQNSYSHEFPQKEVMTVDLIMQIKLEERLNNQSEEQHVDEQRDNNVYLSTCGDTRSTCASSAYGINLVKIKQYSTSITQSIKFENIYSKAQPKWNS